jgi:hypothetical protein
MTQYSAGIVMVFGTSLCAHLQTFMNFCLLAEAFNSVVCAVW